MVTDLEKQEFKQTMGIVADDWDVDEIQNHTKITTGSKNTQDRIKDGLYPFFVRSKKIERINTYSFDGESVVTAGDGDIGKIFHYINGKFDFHQRVYKISYFDNLLDGYFFYLYFKKYFLKRVMSLTAKSTVDSIRMEMIAEMLIPLPEKQEQLRIASTMRDIIELIKKLEIIIEKKKNIKQGTMQELLTGKRRLEGFNEKWKEKILPNIGKIISGGTPSSLKKEYWNGDILWAVPTDITKLTNNYIEDTERKITSIGLQESSSELLPIGTILITSRATIGECAIAKKPICTNQGFQNLVCNNKFDNIFIFYSILFNKKKLNEFTAGSTFKEISKKQMEKISILVPIDISEQEEIAKILSDMDSEIKELETKRDKYIMIKNGMMQKLLTGEIRLT